jgi:hypothetical protein
VPSEPDTGAALPVLHANLTLLEVADPLLLVELRASKTLAPLIVAELSERVALVRPDAGEDVLKALSKLGHTPKVRR